MLQSEGITEEHLLQHEFDDIAISDMRISFSVINKTHIIYNFFYL